MKSLRTFWIVAILALIINMGVTLGLIGLTGVKMVTPPPPPEEDLEGTSRFFDFYTREIDDLAAELEQRDEKLAVRERMLAEWERRLEVEATELERVRKEMALVRDEFSQTIIQVKANETKNIKELAMTYAAMSPESVVTIFGELDDTFVVKLLKSMPNDAVGPVFQLMALNAEEPQQVKRVAKFAEMLRLTLPPEKQDR